MHIPSRKYTKRKTKSPLGEELHTEPHTKIDNSARLEQLSNSFLDTEKLYLPSTTKNAQILKGKADIRDMKFE